MTERDPSSRLDLAALATMVGRWTMDARPLAFVGLALLAHPGFSGAATPSFQGKGAVGVWMGSTAGGLRWGYDAFTGNHLEYDAVQRKVEWRVLFADGQFFRGMPVVGLAELDPAASKREEAAGRFIGGQWGTWRMSGGRGTGVVPGSPDEAMVLTGTDRLQIDGRFDLVRAAVVTGLALEGGYTGTSNPDDPYYDEPGCRQIAWFTKDGRFTDRGVFVSDCGRPNAEPREAPGAGRYQVRDFTLILSYSEGRVVRHSLTGVPKGDPKQDAGQIFVHGQLWTRRRSGSSAVGTVAAAPASLPQAPAAEAPPEAGRTRWDVLSFVAPDWKVEQGNDVIGYTTVDQAARTFCQVAAYSSRPSAGDRGQDFDLDWEDIVERGKGPSGKPQPVARRTETGVTFMEGGSMVEGGAAGRYFVQLLVFTGNGRRASLLLSGTDPGVLASCRQRLAPMLASLRLGAPAGHR